MTSEKPPLYPTSPGSPSSRKSTAIKFVPCPVRLQKKFKNGRFTKHHVSSIDYFWKQAASLPDPGEYFQGIDYKSTSPGFRIRTCDKEMRFPECVIRRDTAGPVLSSTDWDSDIGDKKHLDCVKPCANTAVTMSKSVVTRLFSDDERNKTPGPGAYKVEDKLTHRAAVGGVLPRGKRISCFDVAYRDHRSVDFGNAPTLYNKPRAPAVRFNHAHMNTARFNMPCPNKPNINLDSAGPIYLPNDKLIATHARTVKIGTEKRSWVDPLKREVFAKLENIDRRCRSQTPGSRRK